MIKSGILANFKLPGGGATSTGFSLAMLLNSSIFKGCKRSGILESGILGSRSTDFGTMTDAGISDGFKVPFTELRFSFDTEADVAISKNNFAPFTLVLGAKIA